VKIRSKKVFCKKIKYEIFNKSHLLEFLKIILGFLEEENKNGYKQ